MTTYFNDQLTFIPDCSANDSIICSLTTLSITGGCGADSTGKTATGTTEVVEGTTIGTMGSAKKYKVN